MAPGTDIFLSYNWGEDESGRDNHERVSLINRELQKMGYQTWFDVEDMRGGVVQKMSQGIEQGNIIENIFLLQGNIMRKLMA